MTRSDGRSFDQIREVTIDLHAQRFPEGSLIYRSGRTSVLVSASVSERIPEWMRGSGRGWVTAEYCMHPRSNPDRKRRDRDRGSIDGRSQEIQRLIGRSLRAAVDLNKLGERTITVDCDVLDADGGTRTASIAGGFIGLAMALDTLRERGLVEPGVLRVPVTAISVGLLGGRPILDLCYEEDRDAEVDLNVVGTARGEFVEVQGTSEDAPVAREKLDAMLDLALGSMEKLDAIQREALGRAGVQIDRLKGS